MYRPTRAIRAQSAVRRISTEAAEVLLAFQERLSERHARVKLCEVGLAVMAVLEAMKVPERIPISFDVHDAIWSSW